MRVPPKLMAQARDAARTYGKSDPIDALAVARAALREPDLPVAQLDGPARELRLLVDHREDLVSGAHRGTSTGCAGTSTSSTRAGTRPRVRSPATSHLDAVARRLHGDRRDSCRPDRRRPRRAGSGRSPSPPTSPAERRSSPRVSSPRRPTCSPWSGSDHSPQPRWSAEIADVRRFRSRTPSPATTAPLRYRCGPATANGTVSPAAATANSTPPSTASPSPRGAATPDAKSLRRDGASPTATPRPRRCERSNDDSPTSSTAPSSSTPTPNDQRQPSKPLDIGETRRGKGPAAEQRVGGLPNSQRCSTRGFRTSGGEPAPSPDASGVGYSPRPGGAKAGERSTLVNLAVLAAAFRLPSGLTGTLGTVSRDRLPPIGTEIGIPIEHKPTAIRDVEHGIL